MKDTKERIKVVLVDDNKNIQFLVKVIISQEEDMILVGQGRNIQEGNQTIADNRPDVAIIDLSLEGPEGGFKILEEIKRTGLPVKAIVMSAHDETYAAFSFRRGAVGYITKDKAVSDLPNAIRQVHSGARYPSS